MQSPKAFFLANKYVLDRKTPSFAPMSINESTWFSNFDTKISSPCWLYWLLLVNKLLTIFDSEYLKYDNFLKLILHAQNQLG